MIKRILVGLGDQPHAESATQYAIEVATRTGAELTGLALVDVARLEYTGSVPLGAGEFARDLREKRIAETRGLVDRLVRSFEESCRKAGIPVTASVQSGDPVENLKNASRYQDITFAGRTTLFEHGVIQEPPTALIQLIEAGVRPLVTVPATYRPIRNVLIAYSGSMGSAKTMRRFIGLRGWTDVRIQIVTFDRSESEAQELLSEAQKYCKLHGFEAEIARVEGAPLKMLLPYAAEWGADMIVMGNSAKRLLVRRVFGETMLHAVQHAEIPLFLSQ